MSLPALLIIIALVLAIASLAGVVARVNLNSLAIILIAVALLVTQFA